MVALKLQTVAQTDVAAVAQTVAVQIAVVQFVGIVAFEDHTVVVVAAGMLFQVEIQMFSNQFVAGCTDLQLAVAVYLGKSKMILN